jgi:DNA polymerase-3 subunit delta
MFCPVMTNLPPSRRKRSGGPLANQIFLFYGDEDLLIREKINGLKKKIDDPALNIEQIDASDPNIEQITAALQTQPLLFGQKLLVIRNADLKADVWNSLAPALEAVSPSTKVVIWASAMSKRSKIYKLIDKIGEVYEFRSFAEWEQDQVVTWIARRVKSSGKNIDRPAARTLQEICGNNLMKLSSEIEKMITYIGERRSITEDDVIALASPGQISVFALSDAVADKDLAGALASFRTLLKNKIELFPLMALLSNRYRIMLMGKREGNPMKVAQVLKASPYYVKKCMQKAGRFTEAELIRDLELLLAADLKLKSGEDQVSVFELLLTDLCGSPAAKV